MKRTKYQIDRALRLLAGELVHLAHERAYLAHAWALFGAPREDADYIPPVLAQRSQ